jgi:hypothetical protein
MQQYIYARAQRLGKDLRLELRINDGFRISFGESGLLCCPFRLGILIWLSMACYVRYLGQLRGRNTALNVNDAI